MAGLRQMTLKSLAVSIQVTLLLFISASVVGAQGDFRQPPEKGGFTYSLGMPPVYKGYSGIEFVSWRTQGALTQFAAYLNLGLSKDVGSPVVGIGSLNLEGYGGIREDKLDGGARFTYMVPSLSFGGGVDWNATDGDFVGLFRFDFPIRRGGVFGRGTMFTIRWLPARDQTLSFGINAPLWGRNLGQTRPKRDNVKLDDRKPKRLELANVQAELEAELANLGERVRWIAKLSQPFAEKSGADPHKAMQPVLASIEAHIDSTDAAFPEGHSLPAEIAAYHASLQRAFSMAAKGEGQAGSAPITEAGRLSSAAARDALLDEVIFPYNRLLGQRKTNDTLSGLAAIAQTEFGAWILTHAIGTHSLDNDQVRLVWYVFQTLCDLMEETRADLKDRWEDSRLVWLPLEYGFTPEEHDTQLEMNSVIERAVGQDLTPANRVWYVINEQFQFEMQRSVRRAEDYHVLWIHDFRGKTPKGPPDMVGYAHTLNYLETLTERVNAYDETGKIPMYLVLLDQLYFEANKGRFWLRMLTSPLDEEISLPKEFADREQNLRQAQAELKEAVESSMLMRLGRTQYGEKWLKNLVKVHVNITNPADPSFRSWHSAGIIPVPDSVMRDHRKIFFYDITEEDPYKGLALFTGMGIGEHYTGPNWEDRAIIIQGPGALQAKTAARKLLLAQGFEVDEIPYPLRAKTFPASYDAKIAAMQAELPNWVGEGSHVMQMHNETGFHDKPIDVAKATLYNLMPAGSVLKVPDSLWQSYIYASLLSGSALRGCRVLIIAPTLDSAPSAAAPTMARAHGLMGRLVVFSNALDAEMEHQGGLLKVGLYAPQQGVGDIAGRFQQTAENDPPWASRLYTEIKAADDVALNSSAILDSMGYSVEYIGGGESEVKPKIHMKANFFASKVGWGKLMAREEFTGLLRLHLEYLAVQSMAAHGEDSDEDLRDYPSALNEAWLRLLNNMVREATPQEREEFIYYLTVGSVNMDYRSMVMDGEVMTLVSNWQALYAFLDFVMLPGLCEWLETTEELDLYLPPPGGVTRSMAGLLRLAL